MFFGFVEAPVDISCFFYAVIFLGVALEHEFCDGEPCVHPFICSSDHTCIKPGKVDICGLNLGSFRISLPLLESKAQDKNCCQIDPPESKF